MRRQGIGEDQAGVGVADDLHIIVHRVAQHDLRFRAVGGEDQVLEGARRSLGEAAFVFQLLQVLERVAGRAEDLLDAVPAGLPAAPHVVVAPVGTEAARPVERPKWPGGRFESEAFQDGAVGLDDDGDVLVIQVPALAVGAVGDEVVVQKPGQRDGDFQVGAAGRRAEPQRLDRLDIEHQRFTSAAPAAEKHFGVPAPPL